MKASALMGPLSHPYPHQGGWSCRDRCGGRRAQHPPPPAPEGTGPVLAATVRSYLPLLTSDLVSGVIASVLAFSFSFNHYLLNSY